MNMRAFPARVLVCLYMLKVSHPPLMESADVYGERGVFAHTNTLPSLIPYAGCIARGKKVADKCWRCIQGGAGGGGVTVEMRGTCAEK